ncbi:MAG: response regulator [Deltaproteobacteria bacterium]|nr:response regulator [Deltaproteobacteria bacterium]
MTPPPPVKPRRGRSIRTRLTLIIMGLTLGCLAVGFTIVGVREIGTFRDQRLQAMSVIAQVVGDACVSGLSFDDSEDATAVLARLHEFPDIEAAALYRDTGALFATYQRAGTARAEAWPRTLAADAPAVREMRGDEAVVRIPVTYEDQSYGTIELVASNDALDDEIRSYILTLVVVAIVLVGLSVLAALLLQRRITRPIFQLADVARGVTSNPDTTLRAPTGFGGEIGTLAAGFNAMLEKLAARERELVASRDMLRAMIDSSPIAIIGIERYGAVNLWNASAEAIFGAPADEVIGRQITSIAPDLELGTIWSHCSDKPFVLFEATLENGRTLSVSSAPLPDGGAVAMVADVTERRHAAEELAERAAQLQRVQKLEVVGRLAGGVAHDFNNLITVVMASAQLLQWRSSARPDLRTYIDNIQNAAQRGAALSRRLLAFSRQQTVDARRVDVRAVLVELEKMVRSVVGEQITVVLDAEDPSAIVTVDQGQLEQVLLNMVLNARDAMAQGGVLTLRATVVDRAALGERAPRGSAASWVALTVQDTGSGMAPEVMGRVFEPFFTTKTHGTGLGLATAQQLIHGLGGEILVDSEVGKGTTFTLLLPRVAGAEVQAGEGPTHMPVATHDTVLLVEDQADLRNLIQIMFAEIGYHVLAAATPTEALALGTATGVHIDLLLTDIVMPGMSGPQLAAELLKRRPEIAVIYMTGYFGDALTQYGIDEAAATLIHKPFKPEQLMKLVRDVLDARQPRRGPSAADVFLRAPDPGTA